MREKIAVIGAGSWGTALACLFSRRYLDVIIYTRKNEVVKNINYHGFNQYYLSDVILPSNIKASIDIKSAAQAEIIIIAVPSLAFNEVIDNLKAAGVREKTLFLIASKGMCEEPLELFSARIKTKIQNNFAFIYGPNFAKEVAQGQEATITIAALNEEILAYCQNFMKMPQLSLEITNDVVTAQIAAMAKNVFAIKSGIMQAKKDGENLRASLISQALREISELSNILGGRSESLHLACVVGDLVLTCYSQTSRNTKFGYDLYLNNYSKKFIDNYPVLVEGAYCARLLSDLASNHNIKLPIINEIASLFEKS